METIETTRDLSTLDGLELLDLSIDKIELSNSEKVEEIKKIVCNFYAYGWEDVNKNCRDQGLVLCRYLIMYFMKQNTDYALKKIGSFFVGKKGGVKDHSTVIHAIQTIKDYNDSDKDFRRQFNSLTNLIKEKL